MKQEQQNNNPGGGVRFFVNLALTAINGFTWIAEVFLHFKIGWLYPGTQTRVASLILPYAWLLLWVEKVRRQGYTDNLSYLAWLPSFLFWWMVFQWAVSVLSRRTRASNYTGFAWLKIPLFFLPEVFLKDWVEPGLLCLCGWWFYAANRPLFSFVFCCGVSMFIAGRISALQDMHREQGYTDAFYKPHF